MQPTYGPYDQTCSYAGCDCDRVPVGERARTEGASYTLVAQRDAAIRSKLRINQAKALIRGSMRGRSQAEALRALDESVAYHDHVLSVLQTRLDAKEDA